MKAKGEWPEQKRAGHTGRGNGLSKVQETWRWAISGEQQATEEGGTAEGRGEGRAVAGAVGRGSLEVIQNHPGTAHYSLL